jgi:hypothetical protein
VTASGPQRRRNQRFRMEGVSLFVKEPNAQNEHPGPMLEACRRPPETLPEACRSPSDAFWEPPGALYRGRGELQDPPVTRVKKNTQKASKKSI